jgi:hypothetical protein
VMLVKAILSQVRAYRTGLTCHTNELVHFAMAMLLLVLEVKLRC